MVVEAVNDGMGLNAACRTFYVGKNSIKRWLSRLGGLKETLLLYALCHQFIQLLVEGDELYTRVGENKPARLSEGWTIVLMDRASCFIWELECGERSADLFTQAMTTLAQVIEQTDDLTLLTDGERRYGHVLFEICQEAVRTGKVGRPTAWNTGVEICTGLAARSTGPWLPGPAWTILAAGRPCTTRPAVSTLRSCSPSRMRHPRWASTLPAT